MTETPSGFAPVLAIYDFRSKQEYIYRTNRLQEISGASKLIEDIYDRFFVELNKGNEQQPSFLGLRDKAGNDILFAYKTFKNNDAILGQALYSGGGTLMMIYRSEKVCLEANQRISRMVLRETQSLSMIAAHIAFDESEDFRKQRTALYKMLSKSKSEILPGQPCNVTPFTQISPSGHMPIAYTHCNGIDKELSRESYLKLERFRKEKEREEKDKKEKGEKSEDTSQLDRAVFKKGEDSLLAIVYIDGNNMGVKLKGILGDDSENQDKLTIDQGVKALRQFSDETAETFVTNPYKAIHCWEDENKDTWLSGGQYKWTSRKVIGGGDEITFICTAKLALRLVQIYFDTLKKSNEGKTDEQEKNYACAGIALFHSHAPFARVYEIAEECCENAKKASRKTGGNYLDWYFCRSGLTNDMETIRETEEAGATGLPYEVDDFFTKVNTVVKPVFDKIGRANVKALTSAILSDSQEFSADSENENKNADEAHAAFLFEINRLNSYAKQRLFKDEHNTDAIRKLLFDAGGVCDVWFAENQTYNAV